VAAAGARIDLEAMLLARFEQETDELGGLRRRVSRNAPALARRPSRP
jgi:hypothetical protein